MSTPAINVDRLIRARHAAQADLLAERNDAGYWIGELSSSPLSTATAISALAVVQSAKHRDYSDLLARSLYWLADQQNDDGGWGDTNKSCSNIATTMLARAAFRLTAVPAKARGLVERSDQYIAAHGGTEGLKKRYGKDKTFAAPILANCAIAGTVPWREVAALPFELACLPRKWFHLARMPVVSYAIPALVTIGQAKFHHDPPWIWPLRKWREASLEKSLALVDQMQPESGGFLEATPLTSFVVMSLASMGQADHAIVDRGVEFLLDSVRDDGSWPIDTNLATWNTTLAVNALSRGKSLPDDSWLDWLLNCQHTSRHSYTNAKPGGWAWTDLPGGVPDADDTAGALLALARWRRDNRGSPRARHVEQVARQGIDWLLDLQNRDGGWPTFCRGWGALPFDRSACDLTAHAIRALSSWQQLGQERLRQEATIELPIETNSAIASALDRGLSYLKRMQHPSGGWTPLWFGNQFQADEQNLVYGTAKVLVMCSEVGLLDSEMAMRGVQFLVDNQLADGGWGPAGTSLAESNGTEMDGMPSSVEETALATEALLQFARVDERANDAVNGGLEWLVAAVEEGRHRDPSPIGFYFAKLWYHERLYPLIFAAGALDQAVRLLEPRAPRLLEIA